MLKQLKPGRYYIIVNLDEPYAQDVYEVLKYGQMAKEEAGEANAWPEGDMDFLSWVRQTWSSQLLDYDNVMLAAQTGLEADPMERGYHPDNRERYSLIHSLQSDLARKDALLAEARETLEEQVCGGFCSVKGAYPECALPGCPTFAILAKLETER